jgi:nitrite reductase/ring-hydroxylating ferredoxin subunit
VIPGTDADAIPSCPVRGVVAGGIAMSSRASLSRNEQAAVKPRAETRGRRIPREGEGGFYETWYPVCLSDDVKPGEVIGRDFLDGRVIAFRGENGTVQVTSAYCRHMGADLSAGGKVIGNDVRCPYHHWQYGQDGACSHIPIGGPIPKQARLWTFPTVERWGIVFAYYGEHETPLFELPDFPMADPALRTYGVLKFKLDISLQIANSVDYQHLIVLHGLTMEKYPDVSFARYHMSQRNVIFRDHTRAGGMKFELDVEIHGTNCLIFGGDVGGEKAYFLVVGTPVIREGVTYGYTVMCVPKGGSDPESVAATEARLIGLEQWSHALMVQDDQPIFDAISFRQDVLLNHDKWIAEYLRYLERYPRVHPAEDFIK